MSRRTEILEALQDHGAVLGRNLIEIDGWRTRGSTTFAPRGSVNHHTAGPRIGVFPSLNTLIFGRPDLPGPLANGGLDRFNGGRSPRLNLIAAGRANHAGLGGWADLEGNSSVWGLEVEHSGTSAEPVYDEQWEMMYLWHAAACDVSGVKQDMVCQHFEWAPTRKVDFVESITNPTAFRMRVGLAMGGQDVTPEEHDMLVRVDAGIKRLTQYLTPRNSVNVMTTGADIGKVVPAGTPGSEPAGDLWIWTLAMELERQGRDGHEQFQDRIAEKVVALLPPSSGGPGLTKEQVKEAINEELGFLKPGQ